MATVIFHHRFYCILFLFTCLSITGSNAQNQEGNAERGFIVGLMPGLGMAAPIEGVYESGVQTGISLFARIGYRVNHNIELDLEPLTFITGHDALNSTPDQLSLKTLRNAFLITATCFPFYQNNFFAKGGCGVASYISYNKEAPDPPPVQNLTTGNWGNNGFGLFIASGYEFRVSNKFRMDAELSYLYSDLGHLEFEGFSTDVKGQIHLVMLGICFHLLALAETK